MLFSKISVATVCLNIFLATAIAVDTGDCAASPKEDASVGAHAMLQHSGTPSIGTFHDAGALPKAKLPQSVTQRNISRVQHLGKPSREFGTSVKSKRSTGKSSNGQAQASQLSEELMENLVAIRGLKKHKAPEVQATLENSPQEQQNAASDAQSQMEEQKAAVESCDWHCYLSNYPDLEGTYGTDDFDAAEQHWNSVGKKEGRSCMCAAETKAPETAPQKDHSVKCDWACYLSRYPDLVMTYGTTDYEAAQLHWAQVGKPEGRSCTCDAESGTQSVEQSEEDKQHVSQSSVTNLVSEVSEQSQEVSEQSQEVSDQSQEVSVQAQEVSQQSQEVSVQAQDVSQQSQEVLEKSQEILQQSASASTEEAPAKPEEPAKTCDWKCYLDRYPDLVSVVGADNLAAAEVHWKSNGEAEGRDCTCGMGGSFVATPWMDSVTSCTPLTASAQEALQSQVKAWEESDKFQAKIQEATGEAPASAGHVAIMKYLREKVLKPSMSVLELGCAAGGVLRFVKDEYTNGIGEHGSLVGVELVPGWVKFAQDHFKDISIFKGDITEYSLPDPYTSTTFDLVMLNDVIGRMQKGRYGCFFSQLNKATHEGSIVYMHAPSPMALIDNEAQSGGEKLKAFENVVPHHFIVSGMAMAGFELVNFEHDMDTVCGGEADDLPKQLEGAHCYSNGWPKYTHNVYRKVHNSAVLKTAV